MGNVNFIIIPFITVLIKLKFTSFFKCDSENYKEESRDSYINKYVDI